jgi:hypothetical protein
MQTTFGVKNMDRLPFTLFATFLVFCPAARGFSLPSSPFGSGGIQPGEKVPWCDLHWGFPPQRINVAQHVAGRSVLIVGLPGAFTPT